MLYVRWGFDKDSMSWRYWFNIVIIIVSIRIRHCNNIVILTSNPYHFDIESTLQWHRILIECSSTSLWWSYLQLNDFESMSIQLKWCWYDIDMTSIQYRFDIVVICGVSVKYNWQIKCTKWGKPLRISLMSLAIISMLMIISL